MSDSRPVSMRDQMPVVAAFIDELRDAFGKAEIDAVIRKGLRPECKPGDSFFASENGHTLGRRVEPDPAKVVSVADMVIGPVIHAAKRGGR